MFNSQAGAGIEDKLRGLGFAPNSYYVVVDPETGQPDPEFGVYEEIPQEHRNPAQGNAVSVNISLAAVPERYHPCCYYAGDFKIALAFAFLEGAAAAFGYYAGGPIGALCALPVGATLWGLGQKCVKNRQPEDCPAPG